MNDKTDLDNVVTLNNNNLLYMKSTTGDTIKYTQKGHHRVFNIETFYNQNTAANILAFHTLNSLENAFMYFDGR